MEPKVLILHRSDAGYAGMDRHRLDLAPDVPEALSSRAADLETLDVDAAVAEARVLVRQLPTDRWEIIIVGGPIRDDTEHLGYDVGETLDACWSAIRHADVFLDAKANARWQARRNQHDLFSPPPTQTSTWNSISPAMTQTKAGPRTAGKSAPGGTRYFRCNA